MTSSTTSRRFLLTPAEWVGALVSGIIALALFTRYSITGQLTRDEAIYAYAGQQVAHGVPPYASIFDPKGPLASLIAGVAACAADLVGRNDLYAIRVMFLAFSVATVVAVYLLGARIFGSVVGGVTAAVVMASFRGFAADALAGPDAKTPGIFFAVVAMLLMTQRRWAWAAAAGSLAFLVWQPLVFYPAVAVVMAGVCPRTDRPVRAVATAGAAGAAPILAVLAYFAVTGAVGKFVESALVFPLTGIKRGQETLGERIDRILFIAHRDYQFSGVVFWCGLVAMLLLIVVHLVRRPGGFRAALAAPLVTVVGITALCEIGYALTDFQGYPDVYPVLPYAALGLGGVAALLASAVPGVAGRRAVEAVTVVLVAALTVTSFIGFTRDTSTTAPLGLNDHGLPKQLSDACGVRRLLGAHGTLWALGDSTVNVLLHRRNPDRFIYLGSGVGPWKIAHTPGGFDGWTRQIERVRPAVIVMHGWSETGQRAMGAWLRLKGGYKRRYLGDWRVFVDDATLAGAKAAGVRLAKKSGDVARGPGGRPLPAYACG
ncbi:MAG: hypothetical protein ACXVW6_06640 [Nocardioidaceae bacterium]